ncbi:MAG: 30S ribosome-binding factor RbfA [Bacteroidales bacterium]|jgi:ribosome-binding factor A|nr:30S ribosome-binding factor RbfA [Bacteroidales bacterium]
METTRQQKVARLLQKDLSEIIQLHGKDITQDKLVTVTVVRMSPDLSFAKVYLSIFPSDKPDEFLEKWNVHVKHLRLELGKKVRHQLRIVPEIAFYIDDSMDYAEHIDSLLNS